MTAALDPRWPWYHYQPDDCNCGAPEAAEHHHWCAVTPIYASVVVGWPRFPWPLWMHYPPSCTCEPANAETQYAGAWNWECEIHGELPQ